jgi:hypothetical protein
MLKRLHVDLPSGPGAVLSRPSSPVDFLLVACCMQEEEETELKTVTIKYRDAKTRGPR